MVLKIHYYWIVLYQIWIFLNRYGIFPTYKWFIWVAVVIGVAFYISSNWYQVMLIQGRSMEPSYHHMQIVILDKHTKEYKSGDVVVFYCEGLDSVLVKRIVAGPGESVQIIGGCLYVDSKADIRYKECLFEYAGILAKKIHLDNGQYIVIGDNIKQSKDSRYDVVGIIDTRNIWGIVVSSITRTSTNGVDCQWY